MVQKILAERPFFQVIDPVRGGGLQVQFDPVASHDYARRITIDNNVQMFIDQHQLVELGALFIALGQLDDADSIVELLDGYGFNTDQLNTVAATFERIATVLKEEA